MPYGENENDMVFIPGDEHAGEREYSFTRRLAPGDYDAKVLGAKLGHSKSSGRAMITLSLGVDGPEGGVLVVDYIPIDGDYDKFDRVMHAVDPSVIAARREAGSGRGINFSPRSILGRPVRVRIGEKEYDGQTRKCVNDYIRMPIQPAQSAPPVAKIVAPVAAAPEITANPFATEEAPF